MDVRVHRIDHPGSWDVPGLTGSRLKASRAEELFMALQCESMQFRLPGGLVTPTMPCDETDDLGNVWSVVRCESVAEVPLRFSLLAGDLVHNLRSALDYLVYQLVLRDGGNTSTKTAWPFFTEKPVGRGLSRYNAALRGIKDKEVLTMIDWFQPFKKPNNPIRENLAVLSEVDNIDKHRLVRPGVAVLTDLRGAQNALITPGEVKPGKELFRIRGSRPPTEMYFGYELAFWEPQVPMQRLNTFVEIVCGIIEKVSVFFESVA